MKNAIFLLLSILFVYSAWAQKIDAQKVPDAVKTSFTKQYPSVNKITWELENGEYEASFKNNSESQSAVFKKDGTFMESEIETKTTDLPKSILAYMKEHYSSAPIKEAAKITKADGTINFEAAIKGKDVLFDKDGKFIKEVKD